MPTPDNRPRELRVRLLLATVTGAIAGTVRAVVSWLIDHASSAL